METKFFESKEQYIQFRDSFRKFASDKDLRTKLKSEHYLFYAITRSRQWRDIFVPCTNPRKLQGRKKWQGLNNAYWALWSAIKYPKTSYTLASLKSIFGEVITEEFMSKLTPELELIKLHMEQNP